MLRNGCVIPTNMYNGEVRMTRNELNISPSQGLDVLERKSGCRKSNDNVCFREVLMRRTKILNAVEVKRTTFVEAQNAFEKHCRLKNLRPHTLTYYAEDINFFQAKNSIFFPNAPENTIPLSFISCLSALFVSRFLIHLSRRFLPIWTPVRFLLLS